MKTLYIVLQKFVFVSFLSLVLYACSDSGSDALGTIFIGNFDNNWEVKGIDNYSFGIFRDGAFDTSAGKLRGNEDHPVEGFAEMVSGTFNGLDIEFTIPRNNGADVIFTGKMTPKSETDHDIIRIDLTSSDGENLVLELNQ